MILLWKDFLQNYRLSGKSIKCGCESKLSVKSSLRSERFANSFTKSLLVLFLLFTPLFSAPKPAADSPLAYLPLLKGKRVAVTANQTSMVGGTHLVDYLLGHDVEVVRIFTPEHGFRGDADAGKAVNSGKDPRTGLPIVSLYGKHKKPTAADLAGVDIVLFDIQDVGVRFYTYLSTLHYVMEAAAEQGKSVIVLDRPNPNGHTIDGPVLEPSQRSFVGMHPVPVIYGMTIGEYAQMINGEGWLRGGRKAALKVVPMGGYDHDLHYSLPVKPSPNLPTARSVALYPSLAFFEGTVFSAGRGTTTPFELYGDPLYGDKGFSFTPRPRSGATQPKHSGKVCYGRDLRSLSIPSIRSGGLDLRYLLDAYSRYADKGRFFLRNGFFDKLAGTTTLRQQVIAGKSEAQIRASWQPALNQFKKIRRKYLLYK